MLKNIGNKIKEHAIGLLAGGVVTLFVSTCVFGIKVYNLVYTDFPSLTQQVDSNSTSVKKVQQLPQKVSHDVELINKDVEHVQKDVTEMKDLQKRQTDMLFQILQNQQTLTPQ